jgi:long-subunit acyl-CoA synthetase (AMP-forming)
LFSFRNAIRLTFRITPGYYNDEKATEEMFIKIGNMNFFRTGDIGELFDGKIRIIDRIKAVFKLIQGATLH